MNTWYDIASLPDDCLPHDHQKILTYTGSLTQYLQQLPNVNVEHRLLHAGWKRPQADECERLHLDAGETAWIREINWQGNEKNWVYARVVIPKTSLNETTKILTEIGVNSLGDYLFKDPDLQRSPFEIACFQPEHTYYIATCQQQTEMPNKIWARRSMFYFYGMPLLVSEFFLPNFFEFIIPETQPVIPETQSIIPETQSVIPETQSVIPETQPVIPKTQSATPKAQSVIPETQSVIPKTRRHPPA